MNIKLSDHFTFKRLLRFTLPSIVMMIFTSVYGVVDGFFVSNYVGKTPFAAVNFIMPVLMILGTLGFMFGAGGSALIGKTLGEGDPVKANRIFSLLVYTTLILGTVLAGVGMLFMPMLARALGAEGQMLADCVQYARIVLIALPFFMVQFEFQSFFVTAEKPQLGLTVSLISGCCNMVLDGLLIAVFHWGLAGAAAATAISQALGGIFPLIYFSRKNKSLLRFTAAKLDFKVLGKVCTNGASELMSSIAMSVVSMLYNLQLMKFAGEDGVAAYGVLMYVNMIFLAIFIGYSTGIAPVFSFHYGANNKDELRSLFKKSLTIILSASVCMFALAEALGPFLSGIFVGYDADLTALTKRAFFIYSFSFLFAGCAIFGSSFFTALNDGLTSALISFLRTLVFEAAFVLILPKFIGIDGVWLSIVLAEAVAVCVTVFFFLNKRKKYSY